MVRPEGPECLLRPGEAAGSRGGESEKSRKPLPMPHPEVSDALLPPELSPRVAPPDPVSSLAPRRPKASLRQDARHHQYLQEPQAQNPLILRLEIRPDII